MNIVGLTGGIGSGKSTVARLFGELGVHWVDADDVAREVVEPGTPALERIAEHFGEEILTSDGALDRAQLRGIVFEKPEERVWLEGLLHPIIRGELVRQLNPPLSDTSDRPSPSPARGEGGEYEFPYVLLVSPLLLETDQHELVDRIVVIDIPRETQIERTMARDTNSREQVERIIAAQMSREDRLARADAVIDNDRPLDDVTRQVRELHERLLVDFG
ncbi:dephospho-CoA kinase [Marinobacter sp. B9-2]|nr:dephospho-CoA kinase [Marinobacter sp. B9-2]